MEALRSRLVLQCPAAADVAAQPREASWNPKGNHPTATQQNQNPSSSFFQDLQLALLTAFKATAVGGTRVKSVWDTERERERESIWVCCGTSFYTTHRERERERWRESVRGEEELHEEESFGGNVGEREGLLGSTKGEELYPRNLEKPTLFIPTHRLAPPPTSVATLWTSGLLSSVSYNFHVNVILFYFIFILFYFNFHVEMI